MGVHSTAIVSDGAKIGVDVDIGPWCVIGPEVRIGNRTRLHPHVVIDGNTDLGDDSEVFPGAVLGTTPQDKKLHGKASSGRLVIGPNTTIREHVTIHGGTPFGTGTTTVGEHCMLLAGAHIGHDARVGSHVVFTNGAMAAGHSTVEDRAILGAMVGVHQFARVGRMSMIGAGAMVSRDAPPFSMVQGDRARLVGVNVIGLKRAGYSQDQIAVVKRLFRQLFWREGKLAARIDRLRAQQGGDALVAVVLDFISETRRGIVMPRGRHDLGEDRELPEQG